MQLQLIEGRAEHRRIFGRLPEGCWLPECAYRPGTEKLLAAAGFGFFFTDAHLARAGQAIAVYGDHAVGRGGETMPDDAPLDHSPYQAYRVGGMTAYVRDPVASRQVWSRYEGYPGDEQYLEFHKIRWPGRAPTLAGQRPWHRFGRKAALPARRRPAKSRASCTPLRLASG